MSREPNNPKPTVFIDYELRKGVHQQRQQEVEQFLLPDTLDEIVELARTHARTHYVATGRLQTFSFHHPSVTQAVADSSHCRSRLQSWLRQTDPAVSDVGLRFDYSYDDPPPAGSETGGRVIIYIRWSAATELPDPSRRRDRA